MVNQQDEPLYEPAAEDRDVPESLGFALFFISIAIMALSIFFVYDLLTLGTDALKLWFVHTTQPRFFIPLGYILFILLWVLVQCLRAQISGYICLLTFFFSLFMTVGIITLLNRHLSVGTEWKYTEFVHLLLPAFVLFYSLRDRKEIWEYFQIEPERRRSIMMMTLFFSFLIALSLAFTSPFYQ